MKFLMAIGYVLVVIGNVLAAVGYVPLDRALPVITAAFLLGVAVLAQWMDD